MKADVINRWIAIRRGFSINQLTREQTDSNDNGGRRLEESGDLTAADDLLLRQGGKKVLDEGNDAFGFFAQSAGAKAFLSLLLKRKHISRHIFSPNICLIGHRDGYLRTPINAT